MRSGRFILASLPAAAFLLTPSFAAAGEGAYNPRLAQCAAMQDPTAAAACAKAAKTPVAKDYSYFCHAGNKGPSHTLYITPVHHLDHMADNGTTPTLVNQAWTQTIHGQPSAYLPECQVTETSDVQRQRQDVLAQAHERTVNVEWQYGQSGPAVLPQ